MGNYVKKNQKFSDLEKGYFLFFIFYCLSFVTKSIYINLYSYVGTKTPVGPYQDTFEGILFLNFVYFTIMSFWFIFFLYLIKKNHSKIKCPIKSFYFIGYLILIFIFFHFCIFFYNLIAYPLSVYIVYPEIHENQGLSFIAYWKKNLIFILSLSSILHNFMFYLTPSIFVLFYIVILRLSDYQPFKILTDEIVKNIRTLSIKKKLNKRNELEKPKTKEPVLINPDEIGSDKENELSVLLVTKLDVTSYISVEDITVIQPDRNYMDIEANEESYTIRSSITELLSSFPKYFMRIHRSTIVNTQKVIDVKVETKSRNLKMDVKLTNGKWYAVSKTYQKRIQPYLNNIAEQH